MGIYCTNTERRFLDFIKNSADQLSEEKQEEFVKLLIEVRNDVGEEYKNIVIRNLR